MSKSSLNKPKTLGGIKMEKTTCCLHQLSRHRHQRPSNGRGDCSVCKADELNKFCAGYFPIMVILVTINNKEKEDGGKTE